MLYIIILIGLGLILALVEAIIPGFGLPGILGAISIAAGCIWAFYHGGVLLGLGAIVVSGLSVVAIVVVVSKIAGNKLVLQEQISATVDSDRDDGRSQLVGQRGRTLTPLRPAGSAEFNGRRIDVTAEDAFVDVGTDVVVVKVGVNQIYVNPITGSDSGE